MWDFALSAPAAGLRCWQVCEGKGSGGSTHNHVAAMLLLDAHMLCVCTGRRLGSGLWQQQMPLTACGMRSISLAALQPSDE